MSPVSLERMKYAIVVLIFLLPTFAYLSMTNIPDWVKLFPDDAFYYLQIAWNTVNAGVISFDGVNPTNGFHPLQYIFLVLAALPKSKPLMMQVAIAQNAVLVMLSSTVIVTQLMQDRSFNVRLLAVSVLCLPWWHLYLWLDAGMEVGFVLFFGCLFFLAWYKASLDDFQATRSNVMWGVLSGFLILSRLDMVIPLAIFFAVFLVIALNRQGLNHKQFYPMAASVAVFAPYLLWNFIVFGHLIPVSAVVKSGSMVDLNANWRALTSGNIVGVIFAFTPILLNVFVLFLVRMKPARIALWVMLLSDVVWYLYMFFIAKQVFRWYIAFPYVAQSISLVFLVQALMEIPSLRRWAMQRALAILFFMAAVVGQAGLYWGSTKITTTTRYLYDVSEDINRKLDKNDVLAVFDAGVIGFFAAPRVINLDGLVNTYQYVNEYLHPGRFAEYFATQGVSHFMVRRLALEADTQNAAYTFAADRHLQFSNEQALATYVNPRQFDLVLFAMDKNDR